METGLIIFGSMVLVAVSWYVSLWLAVRKANTCWINVADRDACVVMPNGKKYKVTEIN